MKRLSLLILILSLSCTKSSSEAPYANSGRSDEKSFRAIDNDSTKTANVSGEIGASSQNTASSIDSDKFALIVAVGEYEPTTGWDNINSKNDVHLINAALSIQGFDTVNHVSVIRDREATKRGIQDAIREHLITNAKPGAVMVFHYSGHGQQVFDDNGDEIDGYDEALVPYDAPMVYSEAAYHGSKHLRDDELRLLFEEVRQRLGPSGDLIVVLDACYSGTATRGLGKTRGTNVKIEPPSYTPIVGEETDGWHETKTAVGLSPMVVISASSANEKNYEFQDENGNWFGSLSLAFSKTLSTLDADASYRGLFDRVMLDMSSMAPRQTPQIEGEINRKILGGKAIPRLDYYSVVDRFDKKNFSINGGQLHSIFEGSRVVLYDIDVADTSAVAPKASGVVFKSYFQRSFIELDEEMSENDLRNSWVFISEKNFGKMKVKLQLDLCNNPGFQDALQAELDKVPLIEVVASDPDLLVEMNNDFTRSRGANALQMISAQDYILFDSIVNDQNQQAIAKEVIQTVISYAQAKYLRDLAMVQKNIKVRLEIIPIEVEEIGPVVIEKSRIPIEDKIGSDGILVLNEGDHFKIKFINEGRKKAYISLLDIQPDNIVNLLLPSEIESAEEYVIAAKDTLELGDIFVIGKPYGVEVFKLIATEEPINLGPIITHRGGSIARGEVAGIKGVIHPLEELLMNSYKAEEGENKRSTTTANVPPSSGHIENLVFKIEKAK
ncbi:caspase family protein [Cyclobacterium marinum]|uniref:caspase family protein n=1 Tax=Cyclobacterium marinum TaxID=104 RepID=UPI0011EE1095|nr:caspase family protein [Cyclobacterium marinum]MBI0400292.1 caspase family protein [Cyclobacterium marinum]